MASLVVRPYHEARGLVRGADVLLFRPTSFLGRVIGFGAPVEYRYTHVERAAWWDDILFSLGMVRSGGRAARLSVLTAKHPGLIDVYRPQYTWDDDGRESYYRADLTLDLTKWSIGLEYGKRALWMAFLGRIFCLPKKYRRGHLDVGHLSGWSPWRLPPHCAALTIFADRAGGAAGYEPIKWSRSGKTITSGRPDLRSVPMWAVEPWMFAASPFYSFQFTLTI